MADSTNLSVFGQETYFNESATFFKGITVDQNIIGNVTGNVVGNLTGDLYSSGISTFSNIKITAKLYDGNNIFGTAGQILSSDGTKTTWINTSSVPATFPSGTLMLFQQTTAPTGWTKQITHDNKALRVVTGAASSGGSTAFTSVFASRTPGGSVSVTGSNSGGSVSNTTLSTTEMPSHVHYVDNADVFGSTFGSWPYGDRGPGATYPNDNYVKATGGSGAHGHGFTNPSWSGSGTFTGTAMDFAVQYVDLIIASKD